MSFNLTPSAIQRILAGETSFRPVVQVTDCRKINAQPAAGSAPQQDRYRLHISDGNQQLQAMLATQLNHLVVEEKIVVNSVLQLEEFVINSVHERQIAIILNLTVLGTAPSIGNPPPLDNKASGAASSTPAPAPLAQSNYVKPAVPQYQQPQQHQYQQPQQNFNQQAPPNAGRAQYQFGGSGGGQQRGGGGGGGGFGGGGGDGDMNLFPLSALNPYQNQRWTVKARVIHKGEVKTWQNDRGAGKLLNIDILDAEGSKMRVVMFNNEVEVFEPLLQQGHSYFFQKGQIKPANKKFNTLGSDYEMTLDKSSVVMPCPDGQDIPQQAWKFVAISDLQNVPADRTVDVIGIVTEAGDVASVNTKRGPLSKRTVTLLDSSMASVELTLWGKQAELPPPEGILAVQGVKVSDWNSRSLGTVSGSQIENNPDIPEAHRLRAWYDANQDQLHAVVQLTQQGKRRDDMEGGGGIGANGKPFVPTPFKTFSQIRDENLGRRGDASADFFLIQVTVSSISHQRDVWYNACKQCKKKVVLLDGAGEWKCEKCDQQFKECDRKYILRVIGCDHTGSYWLNLFNEEAALVMGMPAEALCNMKESGQTAEYEKAFADALFKEYTMKVRAKEENYQGEPRVQCTVNQCTKVDVAKEIQRQTELLERNKQFGYVPTIPNLNL